MLPKTMVSPEHTKPQIVPKIPNTFEVLGSTPRCKLFCVNSSKSQGNWEST